MGERRGSYRVLVGKCERKRQLIKPRIILKLIFKK
jgi:hypothetical protein